jgi:hypothetical protein
LIGILINKQENNITKQLVKNPILLQKKTKNKQTNKKNKRRKTFCPFSVDRCSVLTFVDLRLVLPL